MREIILEDIVDERLTNEVANGNGSGATTGYIIRTTKWLV